MGRRNWLEWVVLAASIGGIAALVALLVIDGLTGGGRPPAPTIELRRGEAHATDLGWVVPARLTNAGDRVAEAVHVEAMASVAGEEELSEVTVDFLPAGSTVEIAFAFSGEPSGEIAVRIVGYRVP